MIGNAKDFSGSMIRLQKERIRIRSNPEDSDVDPFGEG